MPKCCGFIILNLEKKQTILVKTPNSNYSFPKGKFEKKKDSGYFECALRELEEETGLTKNMIEIIPQIILEEIKKETGLCSVQYWIAIIKPEYINFNFKFDKDEIDSVEWIGFDSINKLNNFKESRKVVFNKLMNLMNIQI